MLCWKELTTCAVWRTTREVWHFWRPSALWTSSGKQPWTVAQNERLMKKILVETNHGTVDPLQHLAGGKNDGYPSEGSIDCVQVTGNPAYGGGYTPVGSPWPYNSPSPNGTPEANAHRSGDTAANEGTDKQTTTGGGTSSGWGWGPEES